MSHRVLWLTLLGALTSSAWAFAGYMKPLAEVYPVPATTDLAKAKCAVCHSSPMKGDKLNAYGEDLAAALKARKSVKLTADALKDVAALDSDKDGVGNGEELRAGMHPGDAKSVPALPRELRISRIAPLEGLEAVPAALGPASVQALGAPVKAEVRLALAGEALALRVLVNEPAYTATTAEWKGTNVTLVLATADERPLRTLTLQPTAPGGTGTVLLSDGGTVQPAPTLLWRAKPQVTGGYELVALMPLAIWGVDAKSAAYHFELWIQTTPAGGAAQTVSLFRTTADPLKRGSLGQLLIAPVLPTPK